MLTTQTNFNTLAQSLISDALQIAIQASNNSGVVDSKFVKTLLTSRVQFLIDKLEALSIFTPRPWGDFVENFTPFTPPWGQAPPPYGNPYYPGSHNEPVGMRQPGFQGQYTGNPPNVFVNSNGNPVPPPPQPPVPQSPSFRPSFAGPYGSNPTKSIEEVDFGNIETSVIVAGVLEYAEAVGEDIVDWIKDETFVKRLVDKNFWVVQSLSLSSQLLRTHLKAIEVL